MKRIGQQIPNLLTSLNLLSGCMAIVLAPVSLPCAFLAVLAGAVLDFCDGFAARSLGAYSAVGKDLDSLADMVTFGVAPSVMVFYRLQELLPALNIACPAIPYLAFLLAVFSALRLAIFNNDKRQAQDFIGLPTPANALFFGAMAAMELKEAWLLPLFWKMVALIPLFSWLMVSNIPMFSLKMKSYGWADNERRYSLIVMAILLISFLRFEGVALAIFFYIVLSVCWRKKNGE